MRRHPAAVGQRLMTNEDRSAVLELRRPGVRRRAASDRVRQREIFLDRHSRTSADGIAAFNDFAQCFADADVFGLQAVNFGEAAVAERQPPLAVEKADAMPNLSMALSYCSVLAFSVAISACASRATAS